VNQFNNSVLSIYGNQNERDFKNAVYVIFRPSVIGLQALITVADKNSSLNGLVLASLIRVFICFSATYVF
jgi:hypothetical protein